MTGTFSLKNSALLYPATGFDLEEDHFGVMLDDQEVGTIYLEEIEASEAKRAAGLSSAHLIHSTLCPAVCLARQSLKRRLRLEFIHLIFSNVHPFAHTTALPRYGLGMNSALAGIVIGRA
jgi:hypothetical protein